MIKAILRKTITVGALFGLIFVFRWLSWRGILGFILGVVIVTLSFLRKNPLLMMLVKRMDAEQYVEELVGDEKKNRRNKVREVKEVSQ